MKLFVVLSLAAVAVSLADAASPGLSHVVRVGRNGRQVVHSKGVAGQGQGKRRVVRRKQNRQRQSRQFLSPVLSPALPALPPPPAPLTFSRPPAPVSSAPAAFAAFNPFRVAPLAPAVRVAPLAPVAPAVRLAPVAPVAPAVRFAPLAPAVRVAPLPLTPLPPQHVHVAHVAHSIPAPAPAPVVEVVEVRQVPVQREYGAPVTVAPEVRNNYLAPAQEEPAVEVEAARDVDTGYLAPAENVVEVEAARDVDTGYLAPAENVVEVEVARESETGYLAPHDSYLAVPETTEAPVVEVVEAKSSYIAALPSDRAAEYVPRTKNVRPEPIGIVRFSMNSPAERKEFDYSFEAENGIKQEAAGTMRLVDDTEVAVMRGSYEYIGADGLTYEVDWYADETGFHPTAPHLPQSVKPNHPEVAAAVRAQLEFAAAEDAAAAASRTSNTYLAPEPLPSYNY